MGPVGPQDGDDHGNSAHDVEDDEAGDPRLQLEAEQVIDRLTSDCFSVSKCWSGVFSYFVSSIHVRENLREQREPKDDSAHNLKQKTRSSEPAQERATLNHR